MIEADDLTARYIDAETNPISGAPPFDLPAPDATPDTLTDQDREAFALEIIAAYAVAIERQRDRTHRTMTYRERRERRAARLRGWAEARDARSAASFAAVHAIADNIPMGQPILVGHHSEPRARRDQDRIHNGMRAGIEHADKADAMRSRADNIERAADRAIYSDDPDAPERLRERIAELEAERDRIAAYNKAARAAHKAGRPISAEDLAILSLRQAADLATLARVGMMRPDKTFPAYATANLGGNVGRLRERLAQLDRPALRVLVPGADGRCATCGWPESGHDQRHDLPGSPVLCLA